MTDKHFTLDIDPEGLRTVATRLGTLKGHIDDKATTVTGTPGEIGDSWSGDAAASIKQEMTGLGTQMGRYADKLPPAIAALRSLARDYDDALDQLPDLNRRWEQAETDYQDALDANQQRVDATEEQWRRDGLTVNRTLQHELETMRSSGASAASSDKQTTQHNLEISFGYLRQWLGQQTRGLGSILTDAVPFPISPEDLDKWQAGENPPTPLSTVLAGMSLTRQLKEDERAEELAEELRKLHEDARDEARDDLAALDEAIEDGDPEAIQDAMDEIGDNADDPIYSEELVRELGPDGVNELYGQIEELVSDGTLYSEELWPHLKGLNDAVAHGLETVPPEDFADFISEFNDNDYFQRQLALIAGSEYAGGQVCSAAMAYYSEVYNSDGSGGMGPRLYPEIYHYAYGLNDVNMMEDWDAKTSGDDLAAYFQHMGEEDRKDLLDSLMIFSRSGTSPTVSDEEWESLARLYGEALESLRDQGNAAVGVEGSTFPSEAVQTMLEYVNAPSNFADSDAYKDYVADVVNDPEFLTWYIRDVVDQGVSPRALNDAIKFVDGNADDLMEDIIEYQVSTGVNEDEIAEFIGYMLRTEELLGDKVQLGGVLKSLLESGVSAAVKNPATGPVLGVFNALLAEYQRMEGDIQAWEDAMGDNELHNQLGFALYVRIYGQPPEFERWLTEHDRQDDKDAMVDFLQEQKTKGTDLYNEINNLVDIIDESRDER